MSIDHEIFKTLEETLLDESKYGVNLAYKSIDGKIL